MALRSRIGLNLGWVQKNETISTIKFQGYYDLNSDDKQSTLVHEFVHGMQQSKYGTGGAIVRKKFRGYKPSKECVSGALIVQQKKLLIWNTTKEKERIPISGRGLSGSDGTGGADGRRCRRRF